jgi:hypothetical protein
MVKTEEDDDEYGVKKGRGRGRGKKSVKTEDEMMGLEGAGVGSSGGGVPEVRTKFPVARIKRIMQADEDVGKVAQVTPVAVGEWPSTVFLNERQF